jgi:hypothetical protein
MSQFHDITVVALGQSFHVPTYEYLKKTLRNRFQYRWDQRTLDEKLFLAEEQKLVEKSQGHPYQGSFAFLNVPMSQMIEPLELLIVQISYVAVGAAFVDKILTYHRPEWKYNNGTTCGGFLTGQNTWSVTQDTERPENPSGMDFLSGEKVTITYQPYQREMIIKNDSGTTVVFKDVPGNTYACVSLFSYKNAVRILNQ